jgi:AraC family transcriptional regulator
MDQQKTATGRGHGGRGTRPSPELGVRVFSPPAGVITMEPLQDHLISIHIGSPVRVTCRYAGRTHRRIQAHGDIDVVPAGVAGAWEDESAATALVVHVSSALLDAAAAGLGLPAGRVEVSPQYQLRDPQIEHIGWALRAELEAGYPGGRLYTDSLGLALAARLLRLGGAPTTPRSNNRHTLSAWQQRRVVEYIETHLDHNLSLDQLAGVAGVSTSHFKALFRQSLGLPVHQYVVRRRVDRARTLLLEGQLPLCQVALEAGFAHQSHMARWMRRLLDVTPTDVVRSRR